MLPSKFLWNLSISLYLHCHQPKIIHCHPLCFSYNSTALLGLPSSILASLQYIFHTAARIILECKPNLVTCLLITLPGLPSTLRISSQVFTFYKAIHYLAHDYLSTFILNSFFSSITISSSWHSFNSMKSWILPTLLSCNFKYMLFSPLGTLLSVPSPNLPKIYTGFEPFNAYLFTISTSFLFTHSIWFFYFNSMYIYNYLLFTYLHFIYAYI